MGLIIRISSQDSNSHDGACSNSDGSNNVTLGGIGLLAGQLQSVDSAGQLQVHDVTGDEAQVGRCAHQRGVGQGFGEADGDVNSQNTDGSHVEHFTQRGDAAVNAQENEGQGDHVNQGQQRADTAPAVAPRLEGIQSNGIILLAH